MACNCVGPCTCSSEEVNSTCITECPPVTPILPPCAPTIVEEKCPLISIIDYRAAIAVSQSFNIPICGGTVIVNIDPLTSTHLIPTTHVGAYFWSSVYGGFKIINITTKTLTLLNECVNVTAAAGTLVPEDSTFILIADPNFIAQADDIFLADDFVAPPVGSCTTIRVTNGAGLPDGINISIGGYSYWLAGHTTSFSGDVFTLCNTGTGAPPGFVFVALDTFGEFVYPLTILGNTVVTQNEVVQTGVVFNSNNTTYQLQAFLSLNNPYLTRSLIVRQSIIASFTGTIHNDAATESSFNPITLETFVDGFAVASRLLKHSYPITNAGLTTGTKSFDISINTGYIIPPVFSPTPYITDIRFTLTFVAADSDVTLSNATGTMKIRAVAHATFTG